MPTLAQARRNKSLTQQRIADELEVQRSLVSAWERGVYKPRPINLQKLCNILEIDIKDIELLPPPRKSKVSSEARRQQIRDYDESMGYVDATWLRGGRYDVDPGWHEKGLT